jgi:hypothetical protein
VQFGVEDSRRVVRIASVTSGLLALLCVICIPGAFLQFLFSDSSLALTKTFIVAAGLFTAISLAFDVAIAVRLRRNVA